MYRLLAVGTLCAGMITAVVATGAGDGALAAAPRPPAWTPPLNLGAGAEPSIKELPRGAKDRQAAIVSAPTGLGSNFWYIDERHRANGTHYWNPSAPAQPDLGTGGGDSDIAVGRLAKKGTCPAIAYTGLHNIDLLDNFTAARSDACGESFTSPPNLYATQNTATDRQWMTFDGRKTVHLIYHKVDTGQIVDSVSYDGGFTYVTQAGPGGIGVIGSLIDPQHAYTQPQVKIGNLVTDYAHPVQGAHYPAPPIGSGEQIHPLYAIFAGTANAAEAAQAQNPNAGYDYLDTLYLAKSIDGGKTWHDSKIFSVPAKSRRELDMVFPVIGIDRTGNLYALWSDQYKIQYAVSTDHGAHWSKAFQINPDNRGSKPDAHHADIFPWLVGAGAGRVDVVWYHGAGGKTTNYRNPGTDTAKDGVTKWTVAFAQLFHAARTNARHVPSPRIMQLSQAVTPTIHKGSVCNNGTVCGVTGPGDRTLLDFFQVAVDSAGRANIAYASDISSPGSASVMYTRQNRGRSAYTGKRIRSFRFVQPKVKTGSSCPGPQVLDRRGDAAGSVTNDPTEKNNANDDILNARFKTPDAKNLNVVLTINNVSTTPPPGTTSTTYTVYWRYSGHTWYAEATTNGPPQSAVFTVGKDDGGTKSGSTPVSGTVKTGKGGTFTWTIPRTAIGGPGHGARLHAPYADVHGSFTAEGNGLEYTAAVDRAPDSHAGATYEVGGAC